MTSLIDRVAKSPIRDFSLHGKGKAWFSLFSRIHNLPSESWIRAPRAGPVDSFFRSLNVVFPNIFITVSRIFEKKEGPKPFLCDVS